MELLCERVTLDWNFVLKSCIFYLTINIFTKEKENFQSIKVNKTTWALDNGTQQFITYFIYSNYSFKEGKQVFCRSGEVRRGPIPRIAESISDECSTANRLSPQGIQSLRVSPNAPLRVGVASLMPAGFWCCFSAMFSKTGRVDIKGKEFLLSITFLFK